MNAGTMILPRKGVWRLLLTVLVLGSVWGMSEVVLGGALKAASFPYRAGLLTAIGMVVMAIALAGSRKPAMLVGIGVVAALVSLLVVPVLHASVMCKANSCIAIVTEASSLSLASALLMKKMDSSVYARMGGTALAALAASAGFYYIGIHVAPCAYLLSFGSGGSFVVKEGLTWAAFSASLMPLGYLAGQKLATVPFPSLAGKSALGYYASAAGIMAIAWGSSALAILSGM